MILGERIYVRGRARSPLRAVGKPNAFDYSRRAGDCTPYPPAAFTLVELMVVITIIAVVTGVIVSEMGGTYEDALLRTNARKLIDVCDAASNRAIAVNQAQVLRINTQSGRFVVQPKAKDIQDHEAQITEGELDQRIALQIRQPQREEEAETEESETTERPVEAEAITFYPDGSADAREFLFRDRAGVELVLRINPTTSRVRIIEMAAQ